MKKIVALLIMLTTATYSFAQVGWISEKYNADELKGTKGYTAYIYTDSTGNNFVLWSHTNDEFRIVSNSNIFDYYGSKKSFQVIIGLYDENDNLTKKIECKAFADDENSHMAYVHRRNAKQTINYIQENRGYVRIIAPLYGTLSDFDLRVPCFKSEQEEKDSID
jgi:hypothetical protein